ncbi:MAG TPA: Uma2 family endonuclease [Gemmataceae bacterium]|jgi:Uma2 family endonuclease|nr:Uma2 family endonuclease [Gemmataceae bacterium]
MATVTVLGLADHGRAVSDEEFEAADFEPGYRYELIEGRLFVSSEPEVPEVCLEDWLLDKLRRYAEKRPEIINFVTNKSRVFVSSRVSSTIPEPDVAAYRSFPRRGRLQGLRWKGVSPILVAEVLVAADAYKDLVRNVELYENVPSIREYWIVDGRDLVDEPTLIVYRRRGDRWLKKRSFPYGSTYTTTLLPGFKLLIDPRR